MYTISEVEDLTGVKAHILRYWEEVIPGFNPQKDIGGRRTYTEREVELILRLKYLINEKRFTTEGARKQLIDDAGTAMNNENLLKEIRETRTELSDLYLYIKNAEK